VTESEVRPTTDFPTTTDAFLGGRITLIQPRKGHRAGLDAALLQALVPADATGELVDLGAGVGTVAFAAAARAPQLTAIGVERDPRLVELGLAALRMAQNSGFANRVRMIMGDAGKKEELDLPAQAADWVLMNPPFDTPGRARPSPDADRRSAHVAEAGLLRSWCTTAALLLRSGGMLGLIHRAGALAEILAALQDQFNDVRIFPVHPREGAPATRIVVKARRGGRGPLTLMAGLVLHQADGSWTRIADAILHGNTELPI
jgi:tRNA1(Val) A37 N6-methylase TrmN6